jgi:hypothetical protein
VAIASCLAVDLANILAGEQQTAMALVFGEPNDGT